MPIDRELLSDDQYNEEKRKFREKCVVASVTENLEMLKRGEHTLPEALFCIGEECFLLGEVFRGDVMTDEEMKALYEQGEDKIINHRNK